MNRHHSVLVLVLLVIRALPVGAQSKPAYLDEPATVTIVGSPAPGDTIPLVIALPTSGASGADVFSTLQDNLPISAYALLLPHGAPKLREVTASFSNYVQWYEARLLEDVREALKNHPIDPARVFLVGFSLGGDVGCALLSRHPELYRGAFIIRSRCSAMLSTSGLATFVQRDGRVAFAIGSADDTARITGITTAYERLRAAKITTRFATFEGRSGSQ